MVPRLKWDEWAPPLVLVMLALAASVTSLGNLFVYDSIPIIRENPDVHTLAAPWELFARQYWPPPFLGLYRPLSIFWFRVQWLVGGGEPWVFHAVSMALSAVTALAVYALGRRLFPATVAWIAAALFAVHPVHVESVAVAINQSEIMVTLLLTVSVALYLRGRLAATFPAKTAAVIALLYVIACFTKEQGIVLPGLLLAAEITVVRDGRPWRQRLPAVRLLYLILTLIASVYLLARGLVIDDFIGTYTAEALVGQSMGGRALTMLSVVPLWLELLFVPINQQVDYLPQEITTATSFGFPQMVGSLILVLAVIVAIRARRHHPATTLGIMWIAIALFPVSNVLIPTGIVLAERALILPSVGAVLVIGSAVAWLVARRLHYPVRVGLKVVLPLILVAGVWRSASRTRIYHDQLSLFTQAIADSPLSFKSHFAYADIMFQLGNNGLAERHFRIALRLYADYPRVYQGLADRYRLAGLCVPAIPLYLEGLARTRTTHYFDLRTSLIACLLHEGRYREAAAQSRMGIAGETDVDVFRQALVTADSARLVEAPPGTVAFRIKPANRLEDSE